jgi:hypothetical protein
VFVICALPKSETVQMVRPFEKPHGRLPRRPSVSSPSRNHHDGLDLPLVLRFIEGFATFKPFNTIKTREGELLCFGHTSTITSYPRLVFLRLVPYDAGDSAICIRLFLAAGSKTTRTRARKTLATRRSMLKE